MSFFESHTEDLRRTALKVLAESFETFYENTIAIDRDYRITWISESYQRFLGIDESPLGQPVTRYIPNSNMPRVMDSRVPVFLDLIYIRDQWVLVSVIPLEEQGEIVGAFGFVAIDQHTRLTTLAAKFNNLQQQLDSVTDELNRARQTKYRLSQISGRSEQLQVIKNQIRQAARFDISVLLTGETGTGKELFANALHELSARANQPFVSINVSAIPENLIEAEFFGVAPGAYTGASKSGRKGKLELANGGTLFLDEIGDMPLELQSKLLRALQEQEFEPVGSNQVRRVDVRIVAATSRDLAAMVEAGSFRADLYYRLSGMPIHLPPLRDRIRDIDLIAERILDELSTKLGVQPRFLAADALSVLTQYPWPGNIRELRNLLERAVILSEDEVELKGELLQQLIASQPVSPPAPELRPPPARPLPAHAAEISTAPLPLQQQLAQTESQAIRQALAYCDGHKGKAAKVLGISRATLYEKMGKLGLVL